MALHEYWNTCKMKEEKNWIFRTKKSIFNEMVSNELCFQPTIPKYPYPVFFKFVLIWGHVATTVFIICKVRDILPLNTQNSISMKNEWTDIIKTYNKRGRVIRNEEILNVIMKVWHTSFSFIFSFRNISSPNSFYSNLRCNFNLYMLKY